MAEPYIDCKICDKEFSGPEPYAQHMVSKAHIKKAQDSMPQPDRLAPVLPSGKQYRCNVCDVDMSGPAPLEQHYNGSSHKKMLNKKRIMNEQGAAPTTSPVTGPLKCNTCDKCFSGPESYEQHMKSKKHHRKVGMTDMKQRLTGSDIVASCPPLYPELPSHVENHVVTQASKGAIASKEPTKKELIKKKSPGCFSALRSLVSKKKKKETC